MSSQTIEFLSDHRSQLVEQVVADIVVSPEEEKVPDQIPMKKS